MSITYRLILGGFLGLGACSTPTGPTESIAAPPGSTTGVGHSTPLGGPCGSGSAINQICAPRQ